VETGRNEETADQLHEASHTVGGQIRRSRNDLPVRGIAAPRPVQTPSHVPGQAIRLRGSKRRRGKR